jgi:serine/threonine protein kinase
MPGIPESSVPKPGQVLAGKYRVERVLGAGGMGVVVEAYHLHLDTPVALKFMTEETFADHNLVARFLREARATARLRGEHVVRVSDVGELESGAPYMVMEYLHGQDLSALLTSLGPPPMSSAVEYAIQACEGLDEAHRAGFVHRDVKPSNLILTRRPNGTPCIKVVDFGISKAVTMASGAEILHGTSTRAIFGSPLYMAPEQMRATRDVDARADVWSLGASLYELLSGNVPFAAESLVDLAYRIANEDPPSLRATHPEIPYRLEQIVLRCLEKDRNHRFPDARSLALALEEFRTPGRSESIRESSDEDDKTSVMDPLRPDAPQAHDVSSPLPAMEAARESQESLSTSSVSWGRSQRLGKRRRRARPYLRYLAAVAFGGAVSVLVAAFTRHDPAPPPSRPTTLQALVTASALPVASAEAPADSAEPPTVSVMDLPTVLPDPPPVLVAPRVAAPKLADSAPPTASATPRRPADTPPGAASTAPPKPADTSPPTASPAPPNATRVAGSAAPTSSARPESTSCPPFFIDALGRKIFKPECL